MHTGHRCNDRGPQDLRTKPAARLGRDCITNVELIEYPELGMEAIYMITVKDFPAFIIVDDKGNDFFDNLLN